MLTELCQPAPNATDRWTEEDIMQPYVQRPAPSPMMPLCWNFETSSEARAHRYFSNRLISYGFLPHLPDEENCCQGDQYIPDLQITHLDKSGTRYLVDVTTVDVTVSIYRQGASVQPGRAAAQAENHKTREYKSKVDGMVTKLIPAAFELSGRWGEGLVSLFKKGITLATREGHNSDGSFAARWKHRLSIMARRSMMQQAFVV